MAVVPPLPAVAVALVAEMAALLQAIPATPRVAARPASWVRTGPVAEIAAAVLALVVLVVQAEPAEIVGAAILEAAPIIPGKRSL